MRSVCTVCTAAADYSSQSTITIVPSCGYVYVDMVMHTCAWNLSSMHLVSTTNLNFADLRSKRYNESSRS